jgi:hypothetical protein
MSDHKERHSLDDPHTDVVRFTICAERAHLAHMRILIVQCKRVSLLLDQDTKMSKEGSSAEVYCTSHFERGTGQSYKAMKEHLITHKEL